MKNKRSRLGLSILAGGLSFVGAANATDLIVNGSFELPTDGSWNWAPTGHCGDWNGNLCKGGSSTCANALGWQCFAQYNFSQAYYDGPPIPASENPGNYYSFRQATAWTDWQHFETPQSESGFIALNMAQYAASETVMLTDAVLASDIDAGAAQYTFSSWLASDGYDGYPEQPFLVLQFFSTPSGKPQPGDFITTAAIFDRCTSANAAVDASGNTSFPFDLSADHTWIKYVATGVIPPGAREATVFVTRSPNASTGGTDAAGGAPGNASAQTYVDLVKLDVTGATPCVAPHSQTAAVGNSATFSVGVTGGLTYQWRHNTTAILGKTDSTLVLAPVQMADAGSYDVVVNNTITSDPATLTVIRPPVFVTGQWDFLLGNLAATSGADLQYYDSNVHTITDFGTTTHYGIPNINGVPTSVMHFAPTSSETGGYTLSHGAATPVNAYTFIYDVYYPAGSDLTWRTLWSLDDYDKSVWINNSDNLGAQLYEGNGIVTAGAWHRLALAFDVTGTETGTATTPVLAKFVDGVKISNELLPTWPAAWDDYQFPITGPSGSIFRDGWKDSAETYVSSVQFSNGRQPDGYIAALGGASALKIPGTIKVSLVSGAVTIVWTGGVALESADFITGPWTTVAGTLGQSTYAPSPLSAAKFYRPQIP
jgi:hypothetical protein